MSRIANLLSEIIAVIANRDERLRCRNLAGWRLLWGSYAKSDDIHNKRHATTSLNTAPVERITHKHDRRPPNKRLREPLRVPSFG